MTNRVASRPFRALSLLATAAWLLSVFVVAAPAQTSSSTRRTPKARAHPRTPDLFVTADACLACHNGLRTAAGEDVSIGDDWRASMMANAGRDPYWIASVRREMADHPGADAAIQDECSVCHLPMARTTHRAAGQPGEIFSHMPPRADAVGLDRLAHDGVSCAACHQITADRLGTPESYTGGYVIDTHAGAPRPIYGPFETDAGRSTVMRSASGFTQQQSSHVQQSALCATCHTLITEARAPNGEVIGRLAEQMPYEEWKHSAFVESRSCQACHMPTVDTATAASSVLGQPRALARHQFLGGNFFMLRLLNRFRDELGVLAPAAQLERAADRTIAFLQKDAANLAIDSVTLSDRRLTFDVAVENLSGHKLPTGYPSRRAWLHLTVRNASGQTVFESGAVGADGRIAGNDNDTDGSRVEPHYARISAPDQVPIFESVMADASGTPTTGLLSGVRYVKDNRLLPRGFDKTTASADIAVVGDAVSDPDFQGGRARVQYALEVEAEDGPFEVSAELCFQPVGYRWAQGLKPYDSFETNRFGRHYESQAPASSVVLSRSTVRVSSSSR